MSTVELHFHVFLLQDTALNVYAFIHDESFRVSLSYIQFKDLYSFGARAPSFFLSLNNHGRRLGAEFGGTE